MDPTSHVSTELESKDLLEVLFALLDLVLVLLNVDRKVEAVGKFSKTLASIALRAQQEGPAPAAVPVTSTEIAPPIDIGALMRRLNVTGLVMPRERILQLLSTGRLSDGGRSWHVIPHSMEIKLSSLVAITNPVLSDAQIGIRQRGSDWFARLDAPNATGDPRSGISTPIESPLDAATGISIHHLHHRGTPAALSLKLEGCPDASESLRSAGLVVEPAQAMPAFTLYIGHGKALAARATFLLEDLA